MIKEYIITVGVSNGDRVVEVVDSLNQLDIVELRTMTFLKVFNKLIDMDEIIEFKIEVCKSKKAYKRVKVGNNGKFILNISKIV